MINLNVEIIMDFRDLMDTIEFLSENNVDRKLVNANLQATEDVINAARTVNATEMHKFRPMYKKKLDGSTIIKSTARFLQEAKENKMQVVLGKRTPVPHVVEYQVSVTLEVMYSEDKKGFEAYVELVEYNDDGWANEDIAKALKKFGYQEHSVVNDGEKITVFKRF